MIVENMALALYLYIVHIYLLLQQQQEKRRYWVHPLNQSRDRTSVRNRIESMKDYPDRFFSYFRMTPQTFAYVLEAIRPRIQRLDTSFRRAIDPETRLYVTLHFLSTGSSYSTIAAHYALGVSTVSAIILDTCQAIVAILEPKFLKVPRSHREWKSIAKR